MKKLIKGVIISLIVALYLAELNAMDPEKEFEKSSYKLYKPVEDDINSLSSVHVQCWKETYQNLLPSEVIEQFTFDKRKLMWTSFLAKTSDNIVIVKKADKLVGFSSWKVSDEHVGELLTTYVLKSHQKKGLGNLMLSFAEKNLSSKGVKKLGLWVLTANIAKQFYMHCGFKEIKTEKKQLGEDTFDETYMEKDL